MEQIQFWHYNLLA